MKGLIFALLFICSGFLHAQAPITLLTPNGGEHLLQDKDYNITWNAPGIPGNVAIEYSTNGGTDWQQITAGTANTGSYTWRVPLTAANNQYKVRILDPLAPSAYDASDANFSVMFLSLTSLNAGEHVQAGKTVRISWNKSANLPLVNVKYSLDNGASWSDAAGASNAANTFDWNVPGGSISNQCLIKVLDPSVNSNVEAVSTLPFSIVDLALTAPVGGEKVHSGKTYIIKWTNTNYISNVKLEYSTNNGATYSTIEASYPVAAINMEYTWNVPPSLSSDNCLIRISDAASSSVSHVSPLKFSVYTLTITDPTGSEGLQAGADYTIRWNSGTNLGLVNIYLSTNNGTSWPVTIAANVQASDRSILWTVPANISDLCRIKIADASAGSPIADVSPNVFSIKRLSLTAPANGAYIQTGGTYTVVWDPSSNIENVKLEYSADGGTSWNTIAASVNAFDLSYAWTVPAGIASPNGRLRVSDVESPAVKSQNTASVNFMSLDLTNPNGGEHIMAGSHFNITWTSSNLSQVDLDYSSDNGATWNHIVDNVDASLQIYDWTVPSNVTSDDCRIRISGSGAASVIRDQSNNKFSIITFDITDPDVFVQMQAGKIYKIKWTTSSNVINFRLDYTTNNGTSWLPIAGSVPASQLEYSWTVPNTPSTGCRVKISEVTNPANYVTSGAVFTISNLSLTYPNGGEGFLNGAKVNIGWSSQNISNVRIEYSLDGGVSFSDAAASVSAALGTYEWTVPNGISSANCIIQISDAAKPTISDQSDSPFIISSLAVTAPTNLSQWRSVTSQLITWTSSQINNVRIEYSTDNGTSWSNVIASTPAAAGQYTWVIPNTPSFSKLSQCLVRISDISFPSNQRLSGVFTINPVPSIQVTSPNGLEYWQEGSSHNITWSVTDNIANVIIEYTTNNGISWTALPGTYAANVSATSGSVNWTLPAGTSSTDCRVRISKSDELTITDQSDNNFVISTIRVTSPNAGSERWQAGKPYNITWTSQNVTNVALAYSTDNKASWTTIASSVSANTGTYSWTVPDIPATQCFVRVTDVSHTDINDVNDAAFTIVALAVTSPNGGENYLTGTSHDITWTSVNITDLKVEITSNNGTSWTQLTGSTPAAAGRFSFTTPTVSASTYRVRLTDASDPGNTVNDISDNTFTVSELGLTSPAGNERWKVGTAQNIVWKYGSTISNVKVEYTTNNGDNWSTIASSLAMPSGQTTYTYRWIVPNTPSEYCRVRVSSVANPEVNSFTQAFFTIDKNLIVTSPNGGESWEIGSIHNITWQADASVTSIIIRYSTDNGVTWPDANIIKSPVDASLHTFSWQVPNNPSAQCLIKITDLDNSANNDVSNNKFSIISTPFVTVKHPNGGEVFEAGASDSITWSSNNVGFVRIEYTSDNGVTWNNVKSNEVSSGKIDWKIPNIKSSQCRIRITSENNPNLNDISDNKFTINPRITISAPNGGENLPVGSNYPVTWASTNVANVKIDYSTDYGNNWLPVTASAPAAARTFSWKIPNTPSFGCLLKVSDADPTKSDIFDITDAAFTISSPLLLISPNGGEAWQAGSQRDIKWSASGSIANVAIHYSTDGGVTFSSAAVTASTPASAGSYRWTLPASMVSNLMKIRVSNAADATVYDISDNVFTVSSLKLTAPNGGESWAIGSKQTITWTSSNVGNVDLTFSINNGLNWDTIAVNQPSNGIYYWDIPAAAMSQSSQCLVKVSATQVPDISDVSDAIFSITQPPVITLIYPAGGEFFTIGTTQLLKWNSTNVANVKIEYSINNGSLWKLITPSAPSTGSYSWLVPVENSNLCKIRISDASKPGINAVSSQPFTISTAPKITVVAPNGSENYPAGSIQKITWSSSNVGYVNIEYSINNGISWIPVATGITSSGVYSWTVPSTPSTQCKIRITDSTNIGTFDISDNNFVISESPYLKVIYPNGGEGLASGSKEVIKWSGSNVGDVKIEYTINNGADWYLIVSLPYPNPSTSTGSYTWQVPVLNSSLCRVRISSLTNADLNDVSDSVFSINNVPKVTLTAPNGGESWSAGTAQKITWTSSNISNVRIDYSTNNGKDWALIEAAYPSSGSYNWTVPNTPSVQCLIRLSDAASSQYSAPASDMSDNVFKIIQPSEIKLTVPNGKEKWEAGKTGIIAWTSVNIKNVKIEYSTNNGGAWTVIAPSVANADSYEWTVSNTPSEFCRIRVSDALNAALNDISDQPFAIITPPKVTVLTPNGGEGIKTGSFRNITWSSSNVESVKIEYSINNGVSWRTAADTLPSTGSYVWKVPETPSYQCKIRISDATKQDIMDASDNTFTISKLELLNPAAGETILTGSLYAIKWESECIGNLKLDYSTDKGATWNIIAQSVSAINGVYSWAVPVVNIPQCLVRIFDASNPSVSEVTDGTISIQQIVVIAPEEKVRWKMGAVQTIMWKSYNVTNVKLEYSTDNGVKWNLIAASVSAKLGTYDWAVPQTPSELCMVKITDVSNAQNFNYNKGVFSISNTTDVRAYSSVRPENFMLYQNHPNPFNPVTKIRYQIPQAEFVSLKVYDTMGKMVCELVNEELSAGIYEASFDAQNLANGVYIYRLQAGKYVEAKKLILMK